MATRSSTEALRRFERRMRLRLDLKVALTRMVSSTPAAVQIVAGAVAAYAFSRYVLGHPVPLLSITIVISSLGFARDARPRRVFDNVIGILTGIVFSEVLFLLFGSGLLQLALILLATLLVARFSSPSAAFAAAAGVQSALVMLLPNPDGGVLTRSIDGLVGGLVALLVTALVPRDPRGIARRDARRLSSALGEALDTLLSGLRHGDEAAAVLAVERLRRTQALVDDWGSSLESATSISRISPFLRRHLPSLQRQAAVLQGMDLASRHLRVMARRVSFLLRDHTRRPALAALLGPVAAAVALLGDSVEHPEKAEEAALLLEELAVTLSPGYATPDAPVTESIIVLLVRPLVVDLLVASGRSAEHARLLLPEV